MPGEGDGGGGGIEGDKGGGGKGGAGEEGLAIGADIPVADVEELRYRS